MNGSLTGTSGVTVASGATLGGGHRHACVIAGPVTSTGTIAPGSSIGTLTLNNSLTLNDTSSLLFELGSAGSHDLINVGTDVTIPTTGAGTVTVNLANAGGMGAGTVSLIDYVGTLNGDFATLVLGTQPAGFSYSLINNTSNTSIDLQVTATGLPGDYNNDGKVDAADYVMWRKNPHQMQSVRGNRSAAIHLWRANLAIPPAAVARWALRLPCRNQVALSLLAVVQTARLQRIGWRTRKRRRSASLSVLRLERRAISSREPRTLRDASRGDCAILVNGRQQ